MLQKLHHSNLAFQSIRDWHVARGCCGQATFGALDEIRQALSACALGSLTQDDLDSAILMSSLVPNHTHPRTTAFTDGLAKLPVTDVSLASSSRSVRRCCRNSRVAFGVWFIPAGDLRYSLVLWRARVASTDGERPVRFERLVVRKTMRRCRSRLAWFGLFASYRRRVCSVLYLTQWLSLRRHDTRPLPFSHLIDTLTY